MTREELELKYLKEELCEAEYSLCVLEGEEINAEDFYYIQEDENGSEEVFDSDAYDEALRMRDESIDQASESMDIIKSAIEEIEREMKEDSYERFEKKFDKKEVKDFVNFQRDVCLWERKWLKRINKHKDSVWKKKFRNKRKQRAAMKRSMSWAVI